MSGLGRRDPITFVIISVTILIALRFGVSSATGNAVGAVLLLLSAVLARARRLDSVWWLVPTALAALLLVTLIVTLFLP